MKKILIDKNLNWYRANLHCHSIYSDGAMSPQELKNAYKNEGYQILAISDHETLIDHSDLDDEDFLTLTSCEYSVNEETPSFAPLNETMKRNAGARTRVIHLNVFSKDQHNVFQPGAHYEQWLPWWPNEIAKPLRPKELYDGYWRTYTIESLNETVKRLNEGGFLVQFNHPNWSLNDTKELFSVKGLWSLEILNYATERETGGEHCPYIYDMMLRNGQKLYCTMGDDNHNHKDFNGQYDMRESFGGSTMIGAKELKYDQIIDAMEKGNFYCTNGPRIDSVVYEDGKIKIDCSPASSIILDGYARTFQNRKGYALTHAEFDVSDADGYVRLTVRDIAGRDAHTNAYYIDDLKEGK